MKTLIIYYSYTGKTRKFALDLAKKESADLCEVKDKNRPMKIKAYTMGCVTAMRGKPSDISPLTADMSQYDRLIIMSPIWASNCAPPINAVLEMLPSGKAVELLMVSASGSSKCRDRISAVVAGKGCKVIRFTDMK